MRFKNIVEKSEKESSKKTKSANGGHGLLQTISKPTPNDVPVKRLIPKDGWTRGSVLAKTLGPKRGWSVWSHIDWE